MKILWMNDLSLDHSGGACISSLAMIRKGEELGHTIISTYPENIQEELDKNNGSFSILDEYDLIVLNNINLFKIEIIEHIIKHRKYIKYEHDYCYCAYRDGTCGIKHSLCVPAEIFVDLFTNSKLNIFFSPIQLQVFKKVFREVLRDAIVIPAPMEKGEFYKLENATEYDYLYAGVIAEHKGLNQILDFADQHPQWSFHFAGKPVDTKLMDRIKTKHTYLGDLPHSIMPHVYPKYKYFLFNSQMYESFGITLVEALLSGCNLAKFSGTWKSGMESYELPLDQMADKCYAAPSIFWKEVEKVMKKC